MARENAAFSMIPRAEIQRSKFNRSHGHKTTFDAGKLIPIYVDEALPGDTFSFDMTAFARLATPVVPIMDNLYLDFFFFAVPNRLLWDKWQRFMGEQPNPGDSIDFLLPQVSAPVGGWTTGSLGDYFGIPINWDSPVSALPFRAYNLIYNEWFRDENLVSRASQTVADGPDLAANYGVAFRGKRHDYFTSCLPWPQKGVAASIPLGTRAEVRGLFAVGNAVIGAANGWADDPTTVAAGGWATNYTRTIVPSAVAGVGLGAKAVDTATLGGNASVANYPDVWADLSTATAATINSLRQAFQIQRLLERDARGGTRYTEILLAHFGVQSPDARLQRPEFLGGGTIPVTINPVTNTSSTPIAGGGAGTPATPQGNLAAYGIAGGGDRVGFTKSFTEHCTLIGLVSARADLNYYQGLERPWSRRTRYDFYWPAFAHLGEQAVLNKEIYANVAGGQDYNVFGYQERWAEYKYKPNRITGQYRPNATPNFAQWHLAQTFGSLPTLGTSFITESPPMSRIKAVGTAPDFLFDSWMRISCTRPMPMYSVPGMLDHF